MHMLVPKVATIVPHTINYYPDNSTDETIPSGNRDVNHPVSGWLSTDDFYEVEVPSFFMERRRRLFSDVCHGKLVKANSPIDDANNIGYFRLGYQTNAKYQLGGNQAGWYRWRSASNQDCIMRWAVVSDGCNCLYVQVNMACKPKATNCYVQLSVFHRTGVTRPYNNRTRIAYAYKYSSSAVSVEWTQQKGIVKATKASWVDQSVLQLVIAVAGQECDRYSDSEQLISPLLFWLKGYLFDSLPSMAGWSSGYSEVKDKDAFTTPIDVEIRRDAFLLREPDCVFYDTPDYIFGKGTEHYFREVLEQNAYLEAIRSVPRLSDNSIQNFLEIASFVYNLVVRHKIDVPRSLSSAWLSYRYQYGTAKMDTEEAIRFVHRRMDLGSKTSYKCYGSHSIEYKGVRVTCRCTLQATLKELTYLRKIWHALYTYGLSPSFYIVWDSIPYSFIVDWLIPIGDVMEAWDAEREYNGNYDITGINFSLSYDTPDPTKGIIHCYTRWWSSTPVALHGYYFLEDTPVSSKTIRCRILDAASLIIR